MIDNATAPLPNGNNDRAPLDGIRVIDFTMIMSGPMATRTLADAGAEVIKVEAPQGDVVRQRAPMRSGISTYFASMNCGKKSMVLDLATQEGRELARRLIDKADIVVENFRPGVMTRLGLDYPACSRTNPGLIFCSISGFGQIGPSSHAPAYAPVIHAASGYDQANLQYQKAGDRPANNGTFVADVLGATHATSAIHLALFERSRTGKGQHIDVSLMDAVLGMLVYEIQSSQFPTERPRQVYEPVRASDGYVMVAAVTPKNLEVLFDTIGYPEGRTDERFKTVTAKEANWAALLAIIEAWSSQRPAAECEDVLMRAGVPCSGYRTVAQAMADPQIVQRGLLERLGNQAEPFLVVNQPYKLSRTEVKARQLLPDLGEHTAGVLADVLGLATAEIDDLRARGAFGRIRA